MVAKADQVNKVRCFLILPPKNSNAKAKEFELQTTITLADVKAEKNPEDAKTLNDNRLAEQTRKAAVYRTVGGSPLASQFNDAMADIVNKIFRHAQTGEEFIPKAMWDSCAFRVEYYDTIEHTDLIANAGPTTFKQLKEKAELAKALKAELKKRNAVRVKVQGASVTRKATSSNEPTLDKPAYALD